MPDQPAGSRYLVTDDIVYGRQQLVPLPAAAESEDEDSLVLSLGFRPRVR